MVSRVESALQPLFHIITLAINNPEAALAVPENPFAAPVFVNVAHAGRLPETVVYVAESGVIALEIISVSATASPILLGA
jgi:hypothetical protein